MKSGFVLDGIVPTLTYYGAVSSDIEDFPCVAVPVLLMIFASDYFGTTRKAQSRFLLAPGKNATKSCIWVAKVLMLSRLSCSKPE